MLHGKPAVLPVTTWHVFAGSPGLVFPVASQQPPKKVHEVSLGSPADWGLACAQRRHACSLHACVFTMHSVGNVRVSLQNTLDS